jgi:hypothetical protein
LVDVYSSDAEPVPRLVPPLLCLPAARLLRLAVLVDYDHLEWGAEPLVLDDGGLIHLADLVEGPVGELLALVADGDLPVRIVDDGHALGRQRSVAYFYNGCGPEELPFQLGSALEPRGQRTAGPQRPANQFLCQRGPRNSSISDNMRPKSVHKWLKYNNYFR